MNEKTAKLIRKYARTTEANLNDLKRQWNAMDQFERRDFRGRMQAAVESAPKAASEPPVEAEPLVEAAAEAE